MAFLAALPLVLGPVRVAPALPEDQIQGWSPEAAAAWAAAQAARMRKDYTAAQKEYRNVIRLMPGFAEAYLNLGLVYELENRPQDAIPVFEKALKLKPGLAGAQFFLGVDYCKLGRPVDSLPHLEVAVRERPDLADTWSWLATAQELAGRTQAQVKTLRTGLSLNPRSIDLFYLLGQAYEKLGKDAVDEILRKAPDSAYVQQLLAENYAESGYPSVALLHLENALRSTPDRRGLHQEIAELFLQVGNLPRARQELEAELRLAPHDLKALVRRGEIRLLEHDVSGALADWSQALAADPRRTEVILGINVPRSAFPHSPELPASLRQRIALLRGQISAQGGPAARLALAFVDAQADGRTPHADFPTLPESSAGPGRTCNPNQVEAWLGEDRLEAVAVCSAQVLQTQLSSHLRLEIARALLETGRPEEAWEALDDLPPADAGAPEALFWKARCCKQLALEAYLHLFQIDSDSARAHEVLGDLDMARGEDAKAIKEYMQALEKRPTLPNLHYQIGHLEWKVFHVAQARANFEAELASNPGHTGALFDLGNTYLYERQPDRALQLLKKVEKLNPRYPEIHQFLGMAYVQLGNYAEAERELALAAPEDKEGRVYYQLGRVYQALKRTAEAERAFARSDQLKRAAEQKNQNRVQQVARAEAALRER